MNLTELPRPLTDAHLHFFSHNYFRLLTRERLAAAGGQTQDGAVSDEDVRETVEMLGWEAPDVSPVAFAARWLKEMDRHRVGEAAIMASVHGDADSVVEAMASSPSRLFGYFFVNPLADDAIKVVRKSLERGMKGVCLLPAMHRYWLREPRVEEIVRMAAAVPGTVVFVHCGLLAVGVRGKVGLPSNFDMSFSNPIDLHALALRFPSVNFVVPHFGAGYFREALMLGNLCPNVHFDTSSPNSWIRFQESNISLTDVFRRALDVVGPRRLLFGSNSTGFPKGWDTSILEAQWNVFEELALSLEDRQAILGDNFRRLMGVSEV
ncbi:MAG: amidohydrolase [Bryobacterales bacterium]|nr:amidohydrolase [Bryobacterales bacterium]